MMLNQWAVAWGIPMDAIEDLRQRMNLVNTDPRPTHGLSEGAVSADVRLEASRKGARLWRNNVGAYKTDTGFVRYGLANETKAMNDLVKSSDLIGLRPVLIGAQHVGYTFGLFVARETKRGGWEYTGSKREVAQLEFLNIVNALGGDGAFATGEGTL